MNLVQEFKKNLPRLSCSVLTANSLNYGNLEWGRHENETLLTLYEIINIYFSETVP